MRKTAQILGLRQGESKLVGILVAHFFLISAAQTLLLSPAYALFLQENEASLMPWLYLAVSILATGVTTVYLWMGRRFSQFQLLAGVLVSIGMLTLLFRGLLMLPERGVIIFSLPIYHSIMWTLTNMEVWALAGAVLNVRQAKRLFGLLIAGKALGELLFGLTTPLLIQWLGAENLLLISALMIAASLWTMIVLKPYFIGVKKTARAGRGASSKSRLFANSYVRLLFAFILIGWMAYYVIDNIFYDQVQMRYPDTSELGAFVGFFYGLVAGATLIAGAATGWVLRAFGVRRGVLILPFILLFVFGPIVFYSPTISSGVSLLFFIAVGGKALNILLINAVHTPTLNLLYQPLAPDLRAQVQGVADGMLFPLAGGVGGLLLLFLTGPLQFESLELGHFLLVLLLLWLSFAAFLSRAYPTRVRAAIGRRLYDNGELAHLDAESQAVLVSSADSGDYKTVAYAMELLKNTKSNAIYGLINKLLKRPEPEMRALAFDGLKARPSDRYGDALDGALNQSDPAIASAALAAYCAWKREASYERVRNFLKSDVLGIRKAVFAGLLRFGGISGIVAAGSEVLDLATSKNSEHRQLAAEVIGMAQRADFYEPLRPLFKDPALATRRAAVVAAGRLGQLALIPELMDALRESSLRSYALEAFLALGDGLAGPLGEILEGSSNDRSMSIDLIRASQGRGGARLGKVLEESLGHSDLEVERAILGALAHRRHHLHDLRRLNSVELRIRERLTRLETVRIYLSRAGLASHLVRALNDERRLVIRSVFDFIALQGSYDEVQGARYSLRWGDVRSRALAMESLEIVTERSIFRWFSPFIDGMDDEEQIIEVLGINLDERSLVELLLPILVDENCWPVEWTQIAAIYAAGELKIEELVAPMKSKLASSVSEEIKEVSRWSLRQLGALDYEGSEMLFVEKVALLRSTKIFEDTPDAVLAALARVAEEESYLPGECFIEQGRMEDALFVIVDGEVDVDVDGKKVACLGRGEIIGEMQIIDPAPRAASVRAHVETRLLRIGQADFDEVMTNRPEIGRAMNRMLVRRLRATQADQS